MYLLCEWEWERKEKARWKKKIHPILVVIVIVVAHVFYHFPIQFSIKRWKIFTVVKLWKLGCMTYLSVYEMNNEHTVLLTLCLVIDFLVGCCAKWIANRKAYTLHMHSAPMYFSAITHQFIHSFIPSTAIFICLLVRLFILPLNIWQSFESAISRKSGVFVIWKSMTLIILVIKPQLPVKNPPNETKKKLERALANQNDCNCQSKRNRQTSNRTQTHSPSCQWQCHHVCWLVHEHFHSIWIVLKLFHLTHSMNINLKWNAHVNLLFRRYWLLCLCVSALWWFYEYRIIHIFWHLNKW